MIQIKLLMFIESLLAISILIYFNCLSLYWRRILNKKILFIVISIPFFGLFGYDRNIFYAFIFIIPIVFAQSSRQLSGIYLLMLPLFPALSANYVIGSLYLGSFSAIDFLNLGAMIACFKFSNKKNHISPFDISVWLIFLISFGASAHGSEVGAVARYAATSLLAIVPPYYVMSRSPQNQQTATEMTLLFILAALCNGIIAIFEAVRRWALYESFYQHLHVPTAGKLSAQLAVRSGFLRAQGAVGNPATLSLLMGLGILACLAMKGRMTRLGQSLAIGILFVAMIASQSRGGWIATGIGVLVFWLYQGRTTRALVFGAIALLGWLSVNYLVPEDGYVGQMIGRSGHAATTAVYRYNLLQRGVQEVQAHPVFGQTRDQLEISMNDMRQGEGIIDFVNTPLYVALTLGLVGLVLWISGWSIPLVEAWRSGRASSRSTHLVPVELPCAMLVAIFVTLVFTSPIDRMIPLATLSIGMIAAFIAINRPPSRERALP